MKTKITLLLLAFFMFVGNTYSQFDAQHPDLRLCGYNCTANNASITNVFLSATVNGIPLENFVPTCNVGVDSYQVTIWMNYTQNQANDVEDTRLFAELKIGTATPIQINKFIGVLPSTKNLPPGKIQVTTVPVTWLCGEALTFSNILVVWKGKNIVNGTSSYDCSSYLSSQCDFATATLFSSPLAVQFSYKACKSGNNTTVNFTSTTNGGKAPYTYAWDFDNNGTTDATGATTTKVYTTSGNTAKLTVTDANGTMNTYSLLISTPNEIILSETHVNIGCISGNASIDLTATGGTGALTYSWTKNGSAYATTQDLSNLTVGQYIVTVTDTHGCIKTLQVVITGGDTEKPVITLTSATALSCNPTAAQIAAAFGTASVTDNCSTGLTATGTVVAETGSGCAFSTTKNWTVTDTAGNTQTASQTVNYTRDTALPTITLASATALGCNPTAAQIEAAFGGATVADGCSTGLTATGTVAAETGSGCAFSTTKNWTVTDACGNIGVASQTVNYTRDTALPTITLASATALGCNPTAAQIAAAFGGASAADNCSTGLTATGTVAAETGSGCVFSTTKNWTVTDACGNIGVASQTVNYTRDTENPVITASGSSTILGCNPSASNINSVLGNATVTDNCSQGTVISTNSSVIINGCSRSQTRTFTFSDACGNPATPVTRTATWTEDLNAPTFTVPLTATVNTDENCSANIDPSSTGTVTNISDTCDSNPVVTYTDTECFGITANNESINAGQGNYFPFTVNGFDDLTANNIEKIALAFETNQGKGRAEFTLVSPSGQGVILVGPYCSGGNCDDATPSTQELYLPVFYSNSSGYTQWNNTSFIQEGISQNMTPNGALTSPNTIVGLTSYVSKFEDLTGPMNGTWFIYSRKQASVNGSIDFNSVCLTPSSLCSSNKVITRTWTVTDACGNNSSATQTIKVQDTTAPTITGTPAAITYDCAADVPVASIASVTATDNCLGTVTVSVADAITAGACTNKYSILRTWTATDICGNTTSTTQTITVDDSTLPTITGTPDAITYDCAADVPVASIASVTATDNCAGTVTVSVADAITAGACANKYSILRTWTATDICGNTTSTTQTITVDDSILPTITGTPDAITYDCAADVPVASIASVTATDNCAGTVTVSVADAITAGACANKYSILRTWTATDICGNTTSTTQTITVDDSILPTITGTPDAITYDCAADVPVASIASVTATDNCAGTVTVSVADAITAGACANKYSILRTWTATDICGNTTSTTQTITVDDSTVPTITGTPDAITYDCAADVPVASIASVTATDNCAGTVTVTVADAITAGACANKYSILRTWTATDVCGNTTSTTQTITVDDSTLPAITGTPDAITYDCAADVPVASIASVTATDNCAGTVTVSVADAITAGACANKYSILRTWTATDVCGNSTSTTQTITVDDSTVPTITGTPDAITYDCAADVPVASIASVTATDNCAGTVTVTVADAITAGACANKYSILRTWTATDVCGNSTSTTQTITVDDSTVPAITGTPAAITYDCAADVPVASIASVTATDNCAGTVTVSVADAITAGACANKYSILRTWTATDVCGNTTSTTQTITVDDSTVPTITGTPAAITYDCAADVPVASIASVTATDNCAGTVTVSVADSITAGACANKYSILRTWTATDVCGNTTSTTQTITVDDSTVPAITGTPAAITYDCAADVPVASIASVTATDNCAGTVTVSVADAITAGACANKYSILRTWTATDVCGNTTSTTQTITVDDSTVPTITGTPAAITYDCAADVPVASIASVTATDNCAGTVTVSVADSITAGACANKYSILRTWTATDVCGNTTSTTQTITVDDSILPTINTQASNIIVECDGSGNHNAISAWLTNNAGATATDNCSEVTWTNNFNELSNDCSTAVTVLFTATDICGNKSYTTATFSVQDSTNPTFVGESLPANITVECSAIPTAAILTATDNCSDATVAYTETSVAGSCAGSSILTRTWIATDACKNATTHVQTVTVQDTTNPTFVGESLPANITVECSAIPTAAILTATDNCSDATVAYTETSVAGACAGSSILTRTWIATDACKNATTHVQTITVQDTTNPTFVGESLPANITVECSAIPTAAILTATDNCSDATVAFTETSVAGSCAGSSILTRTWIATDACKNATTHVQTITVQDTTNPTFVGESLPANITVECSAIPTAAILTATDNCSDATVAFTETSVAGACAGSSILTRTWIATDACKNATTHVQTITVQDTTNPTFVGESLPANITVECSAIPTAAILTATDNCSDATVAFTETSVAGSCAGSSILTRTWIATDACKNATTHVQTVTVQDTTNPTFVGESLPANITVECSAIPTAAILTATDNCSDATVAFTETSVAGSCAGSSILTRTWIATDACKNATTHVQTITVQDTTNPTFVGESLPANITVECSAIPTAAILTATDNCSDATVAFTETSVAGSCAGSSILTRTWIATDACKNATTHVQTVTVQDTTNPTFVGESLPANITVECSAIPTAAILTATDNCSDATVAYTETSVAGSCAGSSILTRTWIATDACKNATTHVQTVTVQDTTNPTFVGESLPANITVECSAIPTAAILTATDNCSDATVAYTETSVAGACAGSSILTRTWIATDACKNATTHVQTITVQDTTNPTFVGESLPANITVECSAIPTAAILTATDNCSDATVAYTETSVAGSCAGSSILTRTWIATDACKNATTHVQTITVQDTTNPTFVGESLPANITVECSAIPTAAILTATDNCSDATVAYTETIVAGACAGSSILTRTWIATDACKNATTHVQTVTVQDTTNPTFVGESLPANITVECSAIPTAAILTATDNCSDATVAYTETIVAGACAGSSILTRTWIATDACKNATTHVQTITVQDTTNPTFVGESLPANITVECSAIPTAAILTATDNCSDATVAFTETSVAGSCAGSSILTRTWIATDACKNATTHVQTITVQDTTNPTFVGTLPANVTVQCSAIPTAAILTATDNCGNATVAYTETTVAGSCAGSSILTRTWIATDACKNATTHVQTVTVQDTTNPTFVGTLPANVTVQCSAIPTAAILTATDNCGNATVAYTETTVAGSCAGSSILTRTWKATDACNNATTHVQTVTVQDTTNPTFVGTLPANVTVQCSAIPTAAILTATDNCGNATVAYTETTVAGSCAGSSILTRTWIATDACNNTTTHVQTVTVQDITGPTTATIFPATVDVRCDAIPLKPELVFLDNCSTVGTPVYTENIINRTLTSYSIVREWNVADTCGNASKFTQIINVTIANSGITIASASCNASSDTIDLNSLLPSGTALNGTWVDTNNTGKLLGSIYTPLDLSIGNYNFEYKISGGDCPISINVNMNVNNDCFVLDCDNIIIHNAFTPNGDGTNETFSIENIEQDCHLPNTVEIYNRWGILVFETKNYNNNGNSFDGNSNGRATVSQSSGLPTGTYYYIINYSAVDGTGKTQIIKNDGYLYLSK